MNVHRVELVRGVHDTPVLILADRSPHHRPGVRGVLPVVDVEPVLVFRENHHKVGIGRLDLVEICHFISCRTHVDDRYARRRDPVGHRTDVGEDRGGRRVAIWAHVHGPGP